MTSSNFRWRRLGWSWRKSWKASNISRKRCMTSRLVGWPTTTTMMVVFLIGNSHDLSIVMTSTPSRRIISWDRHWRIITNRLFIGHGPRLTTTWGWKRISLPPGISCRKLMRRKSAIFKVLRWSNSCWISLGLDRFISWKNCWRGWMLAIRGSNNNKRTVCCKRYIHTMTKRLNR